MVEDNMTFTKEADGAIAIKEGEASIRYVKESDLLAVKGSKEAAESAAKEAIAARGTAVADATAKVDAGLQRALQAEAKVSSLEETIKQGTGSAAELAQAKADLAAAKTSSEALTTEHLKLRRDIVIQKYGVPKETVESKDLAALTVFEEALKAVIGDKALGNFAVGVGGGGATLVGKKPDELARMAYSASNQTK